MKIALPRNHGGSEEIEIGKSDCWLGLQVAVFFLIATRYVYWREYVHKDSTRRKKWICSGRTEKVISAERSCRATCGVKNKNIDVR